LKVRTRMKNITVCFSGHRPEKLPGVGKCDNFKTKYIKKLLNEKIVESIEDGYTIFMSGMARGIDLWAANIIISLKSKYEIKLICVKPTENHGYNFPSEDKYDLNYILEHADEIVCTSDNYSKGCYNIRNKFMIDNSSRLIAFVNNFRSGTGQTINYAKKSNKDIVLIDLKEIDYVNTSNNYTTQNSFFQEEN